MAKTKIEFRKQNIPFTQVANDVLNDRNLTPGAKGLYAYLYSKPEGWNFSSKRISDDMNCGRKGILTLLSELREHGYLAVNRLPSGRMEYITMYPPEPERLKGDVGIEPQSPKGSEPFRHSAQTGTVSNKEVLVIKNTNTCDAIAPRVFSLEEELKKMQDNPRRDIKVIAWFIKEKRIPLKNSSQLSATIKRHIRAAKLLDPFDKQQIVAASENADRKIGNAWTLETLYKLLTK